MQSESETKLLSKHQTLLPSSDFASGINNRSTNAFIFLSRALFTVLSRGQTQQVYTPRGGYLSQLDNLAENATQGDKYRVVCLGSLHM